MWFRLVPESRGGNIILQRQVTWFTPAAICPAKCLNSNLQVLLEADWVHHMPAVHAKTLLAGYLNIRDLLGFDKVVMPVQALDVLTANLG